MGSNEKKSNDLRELKWKELTNRMDAYRFYIQLILGVNGFFYATAGAVVVVYLNNKEKNAYLGLFLLLPIIMGTVVGGFMTYATALQAHNHKIIEKVRRELRNQHLKIHYIPDLKLLD